MTSKLQASVRVLLGGALVVAGVGHLTFARKGFQAQVPQWVPFDVDDTVLTSGIGEIAMGAALIALPKEQRRIGVLIAGFLAAVFPGNLSQYANRRSGLGLDTDAKRAARLPFQPIMIASVLWSTGVLGRG